MFVRKYKPPIMFVLECVFLAAGARITPLPKIGNKLISIPVARESQKRLPLFALNNPANIFGEPPTIFRADWYT
jgi:hypothetical protein